MAKEGNTSDVSPTRILSSIKVVKESVEQRVESPLIHPALTVEDVEMARMGNAANSWAMLSYGKLGNTLVRGLIPQRVLKRFWRPEAPGEQGGKTLSATMVHPELQFNEEVDVVAEDGGGRSASTPTSLHFVVRECKPASPHALVYDMLAYNTGGTQTETRDPYWEKPFARLSPEYVRPMWNYEEHVLARVDELHKKGPEIVIIDPLNPRFEDPPAIRWNHDSADCEYITRNDEKAQVPSRHQT